MTLGVVVVDKELEKKMTSFDSSSSGDDSGAEEYQMTGQALNDFEKSEFTLTPYRFRKKKSLAREYIKLGKRRNKLRKTLASKGVNGDAAILEASGFKSANSNFNETEMLSSMARKTTRKAEAL